MPVTKTAKRALRSSKRKEEQNRITLSKLEIAVRKAKKDGNKNTVSDAFSQIDRAAKLKLIHKNKAARMKSSLTKNTTKKETTKSKKSGKKTSKKASKK